MTETERPNMNQKQGVVNKCPSCGGDLKAFVSRCELCGHELTGVSANRTVSDLAQKFAEIEVVLAAAGLQGSKLETELIARRARVIRDFPIPNAREDLQSLIYFIYPKIQDNIKPDPNAEDWRVKFKEVLNLAKIAYKGDAKTRAEFEEIERSLNLSLSDVLQTRAKRFPLVAAGVGLVAILSVIGLVSTQLGSWRLKQCEERYAQGALAEKARLEGISAAGMARLQERAYAAAVSVLNGLRWEYEESCKAEDAAREKALWEERRQEQLVLVQKAEDGSRAEQREAAQRELDQQRAVAEREAAQKRAEAERADNQRVAEAERELSGKIRRRTVSRNAAGE